MAYFCSTTKTTILEQLAHAIRETLDGREADSAIAFSHHFYAVSAPQDLQSAGVDALASRVLSCWALLQRLQSQAARVEVFNPSLEQHGWHSSYTVVQVHSPDMPFIVDSARMALARQGAQVRSVNNCTVFTERNTDGTLLRLHDSSASGKPESVVHIEIDKVPEPEDLNALAASVTQVLAEVALTVDDYAAMKAGLRQVQAELDEQSESVADAGQQAALQEAARFLAWLPDHHFVFLGYEALEFDDDAQHCRIQADSRLGVCRLNGGAPCTLGAMDASPVSLLKADSRSRVHRDDYSDIVLVRRYDTDGKLVGAHRFFGLYTEAVFEDSPTEIPIIRDKVREVLDACGFEFGGHSYKLILHILKGLPRSELLLASADELLGLVMGIFNQQERRAPSLFIRKAPDGRYYSCLYYVPKELYNTALREQVQEILASATGAFDVDVSALLSATALFRTHFVLHVDPDTAPACDIAAVEARVLEVSRSWEEDLQTDLMALLGEEPGARLAQAFKGAFPAAYKARFSAQDGVSDIQQIASLVPGDGVRMCFYPSASSDDREWRFKLYSSGSPVVLSDVIPILENLGMRVLSEHPYTVQRADGESFGISDFSVTGLAADSTGMARVEALLQEAFEQVWRGAAENDPFNQMIVGAGLGWREVALLRAYARYMKQLRFGFSQPFIAATLSRHLEITAQLVALFRTKFEPDAEIEGARASATETLEQQILAALEQVESLDDDRILRRFLVLIGATLRTNYYQPDADGGQKSYFSFKLEPAAIPDIPQPRPRFEVFVYSPRIEGVHLRAGRIARGGLRWSDRIEDYRTEVLGLVKAQQVKNSVIVPVGAKGCFIVKQPPKAGDREAMQTEGIACYQTFIRGLLDLTDNLQAGEVIPPTKVVRHDEDDTYLVVAADKGTATFSDIANQISQEYGFWLGDAFASGGSEGYDHKKMGITARGAWESVKRHFQERGVDTQTQPFTVVGIGDMGGDVFGNGMLLSEQIRLVGAFNHLHIFVDPDPDPALTWQERKRLFELPRSAWSDYDRSLISEGGGIFSRAAKWIPISPQMRRVLGIDAERLAPNELIRAMLKAPVDLLWNGGIGTYVKASFETHDEVGDKSNDVLRVDATELRCKVLGEGGNLGFTQRGRIEFAKAGGAANTDFIDNAGGVDCSDHEVNLKILLNERVQQGELSLPERNTLLRQMTTEVADLVLKNNYRQALALSIAATDTADSLDDYSRFIRRLESDGKLDRALEFLPGDDELRQRRVSGAGLTRPELSVLISYAKIELKQALVGTPIARDPRFSAALHSAFPASLLAHFPQAVDEHRLQAEISATQIANDLVNRMGITYVDKIRSATGVGYAEVAAAYLIVREVYDVDAYWRAVEALDGQVAPEVQIELLKDLVGLVTRGSHWLLQYRRADLDPQSNAHRYRDALAAVTASAEHLRQIIPQDRWDERYTHYCQQGVPESLALYCASAESRYWLMDIIEIALQLGRELQDVASVYFTLGENLNLVWLDRQIRAFKPNNHWQVMAAINFRNELDHQLRNLTSSVFEIASDDEAADRHPVELVTCWSERKRGILGRWERMLSDIQGSSVIDSAVFSVAHGVLKELAVGA